MILQEKRKEESYEKQKNYLLGARDSSSSLCVCQRLPRQTDKYLDVV